MSIDTVRPQAAAPREGAGLLVLVGVDAELAVRIDDGPVRISRFGPTGAVAEVTHGRPAVEVLTVDGGHAPSTPRLVGTAVGAELRYLDHTSTAGDHGPALDVRVADGEGLEAVLHLELIDGAAAFTAWTTVVNRAERQRVLRAVTSVALRVGLGAATAPDELRLSRAAADWVGESRWSTRPLREHLVDLRSASHQGGDARGCFAETSYGTWSTGRGVPTGVLTTAEAQGPALAWQVEHNGGWRWELGEDAAGTYLAASGPTDADHQWLLPLSTGESFRTAPVTIAAGPGLAGAVGALTRARRIRRRPHPDVGTRPVVFNDYMNTLMGDPTTAKLLPLIDQAAEAGAQVFCIDAGWYDDSGDWWYSVGEWQPSTVRFPDGGLAAVLDRIRARDMVPGLWLEPEVIGVDSPAADRLPDDAFLQRAGQRVVEHGRYHLDLRHPAARAHLDQVVDRLVREFGVGYFKLDYNINPGAGTDVAAASAGDGLLQHNRAHLDWLEGVLARHPDLVLENCASGAMRMDQAMLRLLQLQSTSDQQSWEAYPPIAAAAPLAMVPEQAANWAYPQPDMDDETIAFTLATAMLGRFYLSGRLDAMTPAQRLLVAEAVAAHKRLRAGIGDSTPFWPLGIDQWTAPWVALGLACADEHADGHADGHAGEALLTVWRRPGASAEVDVPLPAFRSGPLTVDTVFPRRLTPWGTEWDADRGVLRITAAGDGAGARTFRLGREAHVDRVVVDAARTTGAVHGGATGMLYGLGEPGVPSAELLAGVRPRTVAQKSPGGRQHPGGDAALTASGFFAAGGAEVLVYLQDALTEWPYERIGIHPYTEIIADVAAGIARREDRDRFAYVPFNEGDWIWYADGDDDGLARFLDDWATAVGALRGAHPGARIVGPNDAAYHPHRMRAFLTRCRDTGLLPDVVAWHELQPSGLERFPGHLAHYRALEAEMGIAPIPVNIDEYANRRDTSVPGRMLQWIDLLETGKVDGDIAYWTMAGNLDDHAVGDREANAGWWLLHWYATLRGTTLGAQVPDAGVRDSLHALATRDGNAVTVLLGGGRHAVDLRIDGLGAGARRVRVERLGWSGYQGALTAPDVVADERRVVTDGALALRVPNDDPLAAYRVVVRPDGGDAPGATEGAVPVGAAPAVVPVDDAEHDGVELLAYDQDWQQYAGTGRSGVADLVGGRITYPATADEAGDHLVSLLYGTDAEPAAIDLTVDDDAPQRLELPATLARGFLGRVEARVHLAAGRHRFTVSAVPGGPAVALDRLELAPAPGPRRFDAADAMREGGVLRVGAAGAAVELADGDAVRFFVGVPRRGRYRLRVTATGSAALAVLGSAVGPEDAVALPAGIAEVTVTAREAGLLVHGLEVVEAGPLSPADPASLGRLVLGGDAQLDSTGSLRLGAPDGGGVAAVLAPAAGPNLCTVLYSNADRTSGHEYNADVVHRKLQVAIDGTVVDEVAFPFTYHWANRRERSFPVQIPDGAERLELRTGAGPAPLIFGVVLEPLREEGS